MTQYELIDKWREEAEKLRTRAVNSLEDDEFNIDYYQSLIYDNCADDLEALTY